MKLQKLAGATSEIWQIFIRDSSSTTGAGLTGLTNASSGLTAYYHRDTDTTATAISLVTMTVGTFTSSGFKEIDATNMPGWYQFCPPNAALASGAKSVGFHLKGATNMAPLPIEVQLIAVNIDDAVRMGMTALPNAAAEAAGGLYTRGTGAGQINQDANGRIDANAKAWAGTATTLTSGLPDVNMKTITAGIIAAASFAANALDAVWSTATRVLTAGTNIALAKGTGVTGFNDLDAAGVRSAVGMASANLDTQIGTLATASALATVAGYVDTEVAAIKAKTDNLPSDPADASDIAEAFTSLQSHGDGAWSTATGFSTLDAAGVRAAVGLASANLDTQIDALPTNAELATALASADDATLAAIAALNNLSAAQVKTQADQALADAGVTTTVTGRIDAAISTRLASSGYTAPDNAGIAAVKARTDNLPVDPADQSLIIAATNAIQSSISGLNDLSAAQVNAEVDTAISDAALATAASLATTDGKVDAVKAKTDELTFTLDGQVDANMQAINDTVLTGDGSAGDKFGPA